MLDDTHALQFELDWDKLDKEHCPNDIGMYQAVVQYVQTAEDDYNLEVISCTPLYVAFNKENESDYDKAEEDFER